MNGKNILLLTLRKMLAVGKRQFAGGSSQEQVNNETIKKQK